MINLKLTDLQIKILEGLSWWDDSTAEDLIQNELGRREKLHLVKASLKQLQKKGLVRTTSYRASPSLIFKLTKLGEAALTVVNEQDDLNEALNDFEKIQRRNSK